MTSKHNQSVFVPSPAPEPSKRKPCSLSLEAPVYATWGFPKIRCAFFGGLKYIGGLCWGPPFLGNYHMQRTPCSLSQRNTEPSPMKGASWGRHRCYLRMDTGVKGLGHKTFNLHQKETCSPRLKRTVVFVGLSFGLRCLFGEDMEMACRCGAPR